MAYAKYMYFVINLIHIVNYLSLQNKDENR